MIQVVLTWVVVIAVYVVTYVRSLMAQWLRRVSERHEMSCP